MSLPCELWDDVVPESTTVVGDIDTFLDYVEYGYAWQDWCNRVHQCVQWIQQDFGPVSDDVIRQLMQKPSCT